MAPQICRSGSSNTSHNRLCSKNHRKNCDKLKSNFVASNSRALGKNRAYFKIFVQTLLSSSRNLTFRDTLKQWAPTPRGGRAARGNCGRAELTRICRDNPQTDKGSLCSHHHFSYWIHLVHHTNQASKLRALQNLHQYLCDLMTSRKTGSLFSLSSGKDAAIPIIFCCQCGLCLSTWTGPAADEGTGLSAQKASPQLLPCTGRANTNSCHAQPIASTGCSQQPLYTCQTTSLKQPPVSLASSCRWQRTDA